VLGGKITVAIKKVTEKRRVGEEHLISRRDWRLAVYGKSRSFKAGQTNLSKR